MDILMRYVLHFEVLGRDDGRRVQDLWFLHGIFGSGRNWRSFAERLIATRDDTRAVLIDLRHHGESHGAPRPNTLAACVLDLEVVAEEIGRPPWVLCGHSFGGKVAMLAAATGLRGLRQLWVLDSPPGVGPAGGVAPKDSEVGRVVTALRKLPPRIPRRAMASDLLVRSGVPRMVATWMATNLQPLEGEFAFPFDLDALEELLTDYWRLDGLELAASMPAGLDSHHVRALLSDRWKGEDLGALERLHQLQRLTLHELKDAGHWLHVDQPEALLALISRHLPREIS